MGLNNFKSSDIDSDSRSDSGSPNNRQYTRESLIQQLQKFDKEEDVKLTKKNFNNHEDYASGPTITYRFGSWNDALEEAGIDKNTKSRWNGKFVSKEEVINQLQKFVNEEDEKLTYTNFNANKDYPSSTIVERRFGTWNKGLEAANISKNKDTTKLRATQDMYEPSADKSYVLGVLMGDGCVDVAKSMILSVTDKEFAVEYGKRFCEWADLEWHGFEDDRTQVSCNIRQLDNENHRDQYVIKKGVSEIQPHILQYKYPNDADSVIEEFSEYKVEMLRGLWDSEGWIRKDGRVGFVNGHEPTAEIYFKLLKDVLSVDDEDLTVSNRDNNIWVIMLPHRFLDQFISTVEPTISRKINKDGKVVTNGSNFTKLSDYKK